MTQEGYNQEKFYIEEVNRLDRVLSAVHAISQETKLGFFGRNTELYKKYDSLSETSKREELGYSEVSRIFGEIFADLRVKAIELGIDEGSLSDENLLKAYETSKNESVRGTVLEKFEKGASDIRKGLNKEYNGGNGGGSVN